MKNKALTFYLKHKELIRYLFFGGLTTVVNYVIYLLARLAIGSAYVELNTAIAWAFAVLFAYIVNKLYVFESRNLTPSHVVKEASSFFLARIVSGLIEVGTMTLFVRILLFDDRIMKLLSNVIVVILNYLFSKFFVFRKAK